MENLEESSDSETIAPAHNAPAFMGFSREKGLIYVPLFIAVIGLAHTYFSPVAMTTASHISSKTEYPSQSSLTMFAAYFFSGDGRRTFNFLVIMLRGGYLVREIVSNAYKRYLAGRQGMSEDEYKDLERQQAMSLATCERGPHLIMTMYWKNFNEDELQNCLTNLGLGGSFNTDTEKAELLEILDSHLWTEVKSRSELTGFEVQPLDGLDVDASENFTAAVNLLKWAKQEVRVEFEASMKRGITERRKREDSFRRRKPWVTVGNFFYCLFRSVWHFFRVDSWDAAIGMIEFFFSVMVVTQVYDSGLSHGGGVQEQNDQAVQAS